MKEKFEKISGLNIIVIGDIMLDHYIEGDITRMSAEAPIPIVNQVSDRNVLGGAANVAINIKSLGANPILIGVVGKDSTSRIIKEKVIDQLDENNFILESQRKSTLKSRVIVDGKQIFRYDNEDTHDISANETQLILDHFENLINSEEIDGVVLQDYNKGILTEQLIKEVLKRSREKDIPTFVDPKTSNYWKFKDATVFKPNRKELFEALPIDTELDLQTAMSISSENLDCELLICTLAADGVASFANKNYLHESAAEFEVIDVSGAGDSTIAMISIGYLLGISGSDLLKLSNGAGKSACVVEGVSSITLSDVLANI